MEYGDKKYCNLADTEAFTEDFYKVCVNDIEQKQAIADNFRMQGLHLIQVSKNQSVSNLGQ